MEDRVVAFGNRVASFCLNSEDTPDGRVPLKDLDLPTMAYGALRRAGFRYADEISDFSARRLMEIKNIGPSMALRIMEAVRGMKS